MTSAAAHALRADVAEIFQAALDAVDPARLVSDHLVRDGTLVTVRSAAGLEASWTPPTLVVGAGKAAARMAAACERILGAPYVRGEVIVAEGCAVSTESIRVTDAGHPLPDQRGEAAAGRIARLVQEPTAGATLCLISGGASSLLVHPRPPVRLEDKVRTTQLLLDCGADISELNAVRKHLSMVKGGGLARLARGSITSLLISDVVGDAPGTIGSGPTAPDTTRFADAWAVLARYDLTTRVPPSVIQLLRDGMEGHVPETVKPGSPAGNRCRNLIIGSNRTALDGAAQAALGRGWEVVLEAEPLTGDTTEAARCFGARLRAATSRRTERPLCVLAGGETTVTVRGHGRGGRNQEFALALAGSLSGMAVTVLSAGSDGVDGPTDAAGAFVDGSTLQRASERGLNATLALASNDSYTFFNELGDLWCCGPTGTNVMDLKIALIAPAQAVPGSP